MTNTARIRPFSTEKMVVNRRSFRVPGFALLLIVLLTALLTEYTGDRIRPAGIPGTSAARAAPARQQLTAKGKATLQSIVNTAELGDLRWPKFGKYQTEVRDLYDSFGGALPWVRDFRLTAQARSLVELVKTADSEGLNGEDYDGSRWDTRIADLERPNPPSESALVRFDVALTVSVMRYVSDLHLGRVNPHLFHFELDIGNRTFDLSEFLRRELVDSPDINSAVKQLEPPFPTYHRTLNALAILQRTRPPARR